MLSPSRTRDFKQRMREDHIPRRCTDRDRRARSRVFAKTDEAPRRIGLCAAHNEW